MRHWRLSASTRDFEYTKPEPDATLMFLHRKLNDGDLYFVDNRENRAEDVEATFRVDGKAPELWDAATGTTEPASYRIATAARQCRFISIRTERRL